MINIASIDFARADNQKRRNKIEFRNKIKEEGGNGWAGQ